MTYTQVVDRSVTSQTEGIRGFGLVSLGGRVATLIERRAGWLFGAFSVLYFLAIWNVIHVVDLSLDEITGYYVARLPLPGLLAALRNGADFSPPLFQILEHPLALKDPVLIRVPAMLGVWCMSLCLFLLVSRVRSPIHGLLAALLPCVRAPARAAACLVPLIGRKGSGVGRAIGGRAAVRL